MPWTQTFPANRHTRSLHTRVLCILKTGMWVTKICTQSNMGCKIPDDVDVWQLDKRDWRKPVYSMDFCARSVACIGACACGDCLRKGTQCGQLKGEVGVRCSNKYLNVLSFTKIRKASSSAAHPEPVNRLWKRVVSRDNDDSSPGSKWPVRREKQKNNHPFLLQTGKGKVAQEEWKNGNVHPQ